MSPGDEYPRKLCPGGNFSFDTGSIATEGEPQQNDTSTALDTSTASLVTTTSTEAFSEKKGISVAHQSLTTTGSIPTECEPQQMILVLL